MLKCLLLLFVGSVVSDIKKPNFVIVLTDDQDVVLGGMTPMKNVQRYIQNEGLTFTNSFVPAPICCPSRASLLSGLYVHNHQTHNNSHSGGCAGAVWAYHETRTFAALLHNAGYNTFYAGKYMNEYGMPRAGGAERVPPGWTEWHGLVGNSVYYNYTISNNGVPTFSADLYLTDVLRDLSLSYIENQVGDVPFLMMVSPPAPHQPFTPAVRHMGRFGNVTAVRHPNFNVASQDKHWLTRMEPSPLPAAVLPELDRAYRGRWKSLLAVDEMVGDIVDMLDSRALLDNTYVVFTSDNGYHIGQFSQVYDKRQPYEADIRVPLVVRGPGVPRGARSVRPTLSIDLAPTLLALAGLAAPAHMDGAPLELAASEQLTERFMLVEYYGEGGGESVDARCPWYYDRENLAQCHASYACKCQDARNNTFACVRHLAPRIDFKYCQFADDERLVEVYDLAEDPYELENIVDSVLPSVKHWYRLVLSQLLKCRGRDSCGAPLAVRRKLA